MAKRGRPKLKDPKEHVTLRLRKSLKKIVEKAALTEDRSVSYMIEKAVEEKYA